MRLIGDLTMEEVLRSIQNERVLSITIVTEKQTIRLDQKPCGSIMAHQILSRFVDDEVSQDAANGS